MAYLTMVCLLAFVVSISLSFYDMALIGQGGQSGSIELPLDLMLVGTLGFFYGVVQNA
jgi:hypothetical protein